MSARETDIVAEIETVLRRILGARLDRGECFWLRQDGDDGDDELSTWHVTDLAHHLAALAEQPTEPGRVAALVAGLEEIDKMFPGQVRELIGPDLCDRLLAALAERPAEHTPDLGGCDVPGCDRIRSHRHEPIHVTRAEQPAEPDLVAAFEAAEVIVAGDWARGRDRWATPTRDAATRMAAVAQARIDAAVAAGLAVADQLNVASAHLRHRGPALNAAQQSVIADRLDRLAETLRGGE